LKNHPWGILCN